MDMAFRNRRGRWELDGHELAGGSVVGVNVCDRGIRARVKYDNDRLKVYCLPLNGDGARLMSTTTKLHRLRATTGKRND